MENIIFLTTQDAEYGFGLAGLHHYTAKAENAGHTLLDITGRYDTGLVIIDERLHKEIGDRQIKDIEKSWKGILLVLPSPVRPETEAEDFASRLIRQAIGYHVRIDL